MAHSSPSAPTPHRHAPHQGQPDADEGDFLELGTALLAEHTASVVAWLPVPAAPRQVVDLGCGTGAGTFALLRRFPDAHVTAVDASPAHLHRLRQQAQAGGTSGRVRPVLADLDGDWPDLGRPDLVWASASMHHLGEPDLTLRRVHDLLAADGLLAVVEFDDFPRVLPPGAPEERPGLEERAHAALARHRAEELPHLGADWGARLAAAGFDVVGEQTTPVRVAGSSTPAVGRYALATLTRIREAVRGVLDTDDLAALDRLLDPADPGGVLRRGDLVFRTERTVWAARRP